MTLFPYTTLFRSLLSHKSPPVRFGCFLVYHSLSQPANRKSGPFTPLFPDFPRGRTARYFSQIYEYNRRWSLNGKPALYIYNPKLLEHAAPSSSFSGKTPPTLGAYPIRKLIPAERKLLFSGCCFIMNRLTNHDLWRKTE